MKCSKKIFTTVPLAIMAAATVMLSCSRESNPGEEKEGPVAVSFAVRNPDASDTKGSAPLTLTGLRSRGFGVSAYFRNENGFFNGIDDEHLYFHNHTVSFLQNVGTYDDWVLSPAEYWPLNSSLSFFAYAPYMDSADPMLVFPTADTETMPRGRFTQKTSPSAQVDFCLSAPALDRDASGGHVPLEFNHALTKVLLYVNVTGVPAEVANLQYRLESVRWSGLVNANSFTFGGSTNGFRWDALPRTDLAKRNTSYMLTMSSGELSSSALPAVGLHEHPTTLDRFLCVNGSESGILYMLPQPISEVGQVEFNLKGYIVSGGTWTPYETRDPIVVKLPVETVWQAGKVVCYTVTLDVTNWKEIMFNVQLTDWGSSTQNFIIPVS